ncbi:MAG: Cupin 2, conserved barrel domain protein [Magnetococcales bacterium]|nr:Cupin 2, conserved barrel domain protein [Magnetococcales bacterium]HIJ85745.1 hypothetical protein [Magnetococcales bacterium]
MEETVKIYGGNQVSSVKVNEAGIFYFAKEPYVYYQNLMIAGTRHTVDNLESFTVLFSRVHSDGLVRIEETGEHLHPGDSMQVEQGKATLVAEAGTPRILISGVKENVREPKGMTITRNGQHYKVSKPWGYELWFNRQHPGYSLKEVYIQSGHRTSLQYHNYKIETNILFMGRTLLDYQIEGEGELRSIMLDPVTSMHVTPPVLHRLKSIENTLLYETSTPHLDDVVRIEDDNNRGHGRIQHEHQGNQ